MNDIMYLSATMIIGFRKNNYIAMYFAFNVGFTPDLTHWRSPDVGCQYYILSQCFTGSGEIERFEKKKKKKEKKKKKNEEDEEEEEGEEEEEKE